MKRRGSEFYLDQRSACKEQIALLNKFNLAPLPSPPGRMPLKPALRKAFSKRNAKLRKSVPAKLHSPGHS